MNQEPFGDWSHQYTPQEHNMQPPVNIYKEKEVLRHDYLFWLIILLIAGILFPSNSPLIAIFGAVLAGMSLSVGISLKRSLYAFIGLLIFAFLLGILRTPEGTPIKLTAPPEKPQYFSIIQERSSKSIDAIFSSQKSEILQAMLLGNTQKLSWETKNSLNRSGLRHITAISGMHIATIYILLTFFFVAIGLWRQHALVVSSIIMILYVLLIGAPPSAVRALIMGMFLVFSELLGRPGNGARFLVFAASIMIFLNPQIVWSIGFQLSFSAVLGIIFLSPIFERAFERFPNPLHIQTLISISLAAQVSVFPLLLFYFGEGSIVGILVNILIIPLLPLLLVSSFVAVALGIIHPLLGIIFSVPATILLSGLLFIMNFAATPSFSTVIVPSFSWALIIPYYFILMLIVLHKKASAGAPSN